MEVLLKLINALFKLLFAEAILFSPIIILIAASGGNLSRVIKYLVLFSLAVAPHLLWKKYNNLIQGERRSITIMAFSLIVGVLIFIGFSGILLASCAGHPPI